MVRKIFKWLSFFFLQIHCQSAGMKAMSAEMTVELLEISRQACGGHGYLAASALGDVVASAKALVTVEGENTVLYLQVARCVK